MQDSETTDLKPIDEKILASLRDGRNVPSNLAEQHGTSRQWIQNRLGVLEAGDHVHNVGRGVYELTDAPRDAAESTTRASDAETGQTPSHNDTVDRERARRVLERHETALERGDRAAVEETLGELQDVLADA